MSEDLRNRTFPIVSTIDVIVQFRSTEAEQNHQKVVQKGGLLTRRLTTAMGAYRIPSDQLQELSLDPEVEFISPDRELHAASFAGTPDYGWMTALNTADPKSVPAFDGTGIGVAVIDSGIDSALELNDPHGKSRIVYSESFIPGDSSTADRYGHGTHVAGIIGARVYNDPQGVFYYTVRGVAPGVNLLNLRVLDKNGAGTDSAVIAAIQRAIALRSQYNVRIINLSLGRPVFGSYTTDPLCQAVQQAWSAGIIVIVAAGNEGRNNSAGTAGYATIAAPGNSPSVITVGAMNTLGSPGRTDDKITSYSSKGPSLIDHVVKPDLVAPGNRVFSLRDTGSTLDSAHPENRVPMALCTSGNTQATGGAYYQLSGTSMAAPMAAGAAALLLQKNPNLTADQVKAVLMKTASKFPKGNSVSVDPGTGIAYTSQYDIFTIGAGYLDLKAALASAELPRGTAGSPVAAFDKATGKVYLVSGGSVVWGSSAARSSSVVWGSTAAWGSSVVWGDSVVWGSSVVWGDSVVWGSSVVWGDCALASSGIAYGAGAIWGNSVVWGSGGMVQSDALAVALNGEN